MISTIDTLLNWKIDGRVLNVDITFLYISFLLLIIFFIVDIILLIWKKNDYNILCKSRCKLLIHILLFFGLLARVEFIFNKTLGDPFTTAGQIDVIYILIYSFTRIFLFSYFIIIIGYILKYIKILLKKLVNQKLN